MGRSGGRDGVGVDRDEDMAGEGLAVGWSRVMGVRRVAGVGGGGWALV